MRWRWRRRRLFIHAGLHKTGTTAVQVALAAASAGLQATGVLYPETGRPRNGGPGDAGQHNLAWELAEDGRFDPALGTIDAAAEEIARFAGDAVLSSEDFEGVLGRPERLRRLTGHTALRRHTVRLVVTLRDQIEYAESLFAELVWHGWQGEVTAFCDEALAHGMVAHRAWVFHFDYAALVAGLEALAPARAITLPYAAPGRGSPVTALLGLLGGAMPVRNGGEGTANRRRSLADGFARFCAGRLGRDVESFRERLGAVAAPVFGGRTARLSARRRRALRERFADGNARVARAAGFPLAALQWADEPPPGSVDAEALFRIETADAVGAWLDGRIGDAALALTLTTAVRS